MVLLHPAATSILCAEEHQHRGFELRHFAFAKGFTSQATRQNGVQLGVGRFRKQHYVQGVVGDFATVSGKMVQTFGQRALQVRKTANIGVGHFTQLSHIVIEGRLLDVERFIRAPARQHLDIK